MKGQVTVILRGYTYEQVKTVCDVLKMGTKVKNVEITLNTEGALDTIQKIVSQYQGELCIGAGTVVDFDDLKAVISLGVSFVLSPVGFTQEMIYYCKEHHVTSIPAALTPSEIYHQIQMGADMIKVFPANEVSWNYAKKVCEPLGTLPLMAVGGVNRGNVKEVLTKGGYTYAGSAGGIFKKEDILQQNQENLKKSLLIFEEQLP